MGFEPKKVNPKYILELEDPQQSASVSVEPEQADSRAPSEDKTQEQPTDEPDEVVSPEADLAPELRDWHDLPMLSKLDSINLLIEWMFHNPHRIRSIMRDDDETAQWVSSSFRTYKRSHGAQYSLAHRTHRVRRQEERVLAHRW